MPARGPRAQWEDISSYSQGERRGSAPKSWELRTSADLRIVVTRRFGLEGWYLLSEGFDCRQLNDDVEEAKLEAIRLVRERLVHMLDSLPPEPSKGDKRATNRVRKGR